MKSSRTALALAVTFLSIGLSSSFECRADLQDPPYREQGPIRKLGRGFANLAFGSSEMAVTFDSNNRAFGNSSAFSYGLFSGVTRTLMRMGVGFYDIFTFPVASYKGSYASPLPSVAPWVQNGFEEFPPELGFETRFNYVRSQGPFSRLP